MKAAIQSINIGIKFPIHREVRRQANDIEDMFKEYYNQPTVISIPDEVEPLIPRISIISKYGHSQINFSQIGVDFNVNFDDEYKYDYTKCEKYIDFRLRLINEYLKKSNIDTLYYIGMNSGIRFASEDGFNEVDEIKSMYLKNMKIDNLYDYTEKITLLENEEYYHNISIGNYRDFTGNIINSSNPAIVCFEKAEVSQKGLLVNIDINNRYKYTMNGGTTRTDELNDVFDYLYEANREWVDNKIYEFLPFKGRK